MVGSAGGQGGWAWLLLHLLGHLPGWWRPALGRESALTQPAFAYDLHLHANPRWLRTNLDTHTVPTHAHTYTLMHTHIPAHVCMQIHTHTSTHTPMHTDTPAPLHVHPLSWNFHLPGKVVHGLMLGLCPPS